MRGVDYSWARPGGAAIREAGFEFVMRYVDYPGAGGKGLLPDEVADLQANGLAIGLVYESTAARALDGYAAGQSDAHAAIAGAAKIGFPESLPIYFAIDTDINHTLYDEIVDYFNGVVSVIGARRAGVYGEYEALWLLQAYGLAQWYWQALAWSGGVAFESRHIYQYRNGQTINGGAVDYNEAYGEDQGLWKEEDSPLKLTEQQTENLLLRVFAGSEYDGVETREQRLSRALGELEKAEKVQSINDATLSAMAVATAHIDAHTNGDAEAEHSHAAYSRKGHHHTTGEDE